MCSDIIQFYLYALVLDYMTPIYYWDRPGSSLGLRLRELPGLCTDSYIYFIVLLTPLVVWLLSTIEIDWSSACDLVAGRAVSLCTGAYNTNVYNNTTESYKNLNLPISFVTFSPEMDSGVTSYTTDANSAWSIGCIILWHMPNCL